jgi:hypothetical protein
LRVRPSAPRGTHVGEGEVEAKLLPLNSLDCSQLMMNAGVQRMKRISIFI